MSTPSRSASSVALPSARTLNPMMIASDADARLTLFSVTPPTPRWMIRSSTSSSTSILSRASSSASTVPETSPLMIRLRARLALLQRRVEVLQRDALAVRAASALRLRALPLLGDLTRDAVLVDDQNVSPAPGTEVKPSTCTGRDGSASSTSSPCSSSMRADAAVGVARDDRVADPQRAALDQHGGDRAATLVEVCLDRDTLGVLVGVGPQVQRGVGGQQHRLEQRVDVGARLGRDVDEHRLAAVLLGDQAVLGELLADLVRVGALLVDLVDRHDDRHVGRLGVVERLDRLRHDAVVGRDHEDRDVGGLRTTGTHGGERLVTRGVDEGDRAARCPRVRCDLVGADVLGDATGLARADVGLTDRVEQAGLAVVDVTHDGDDRRTETADRPRRPRPRRRSRSKRLEQLAVLVLGGDDLDLVAELAAEQLEGVVVERLGRGGHLAEVEQRLRPATAGLALILSAKSDSDAPRASRMVSPLPRGNRTPPTTGPACSRIPGASPAWTCGHGGLHRRRRPKAPAAPPPLTGTTTAAAATAAATTGTRRGSRPRARHRGAGAAAGTATAVVPPPPPAPPDAPPPGRPPGAEPGPRLPGPGAGPPGRPLGRRAAAPAGRGRHVAGRGAGPGTATGTGLPPGATGCACGGRGTARRPGCCRGERVVAGRAACARRAWAGPGRATRGRAAGRRAGRGDRGAAARPRVPAGAGAGGRRRAGGGAAAGGRGRAGRRGAAPVSGRSGRAARWRRRAVRRSGCAVRRAWPPRRAHSEVRRFRAAASAGAGLEPPEAPPAAGGRRAPRWSRMRT